MASYTKLTDKNIYDIAEKYQLSVKDYSPMIGGNGNSSYIIHTHDQSYVLTICDDKNFQEAQNMGLLLKLLAKHDMPCTRLIMSTDIKVLTTFQDKPVMLKAYIKGEVIEQLTPDMLMDVGEQLAKLNQIKAPDFLPQQHPYGMSLFQSVIGLNIDLKYEVWLKQELAFYKANISEETPKGLIHGDLFYDNILFENKNFKAIIDFEEACFYYYAFEIGMAIIGTCTFENKIDYQSVRALLKGYETVRKLSNLEKNSLQTFTRYAATATSYWRFNNYNINQPNKEKSKTHWEMVSVAKEVAEIKPSNFLGLIF